MKKYLFIFLFIIIGSALAFGGGILIAEVKMKLGKNKIASVSNEKKLSPAEIRNIVDNLERGPAKNETRVFSNKETDDREMSETAEKTDFNEKIEIKTDTDLEDNSPEEDPDDIIEDPEAENL